MKEEYDKALMSLALEVVRKNEANEKYKTMKQLNLADNENGSNKVNTVNDEECDADWSDISDSEDIEDKFICVKCNHKCKTKNYLNKHMKIHSNRKVNNMCVQCEKSFPQIEEFRKHVQDHKQELQCIKCDYVSNNKNNLIEHMEIHTQETTNKCTQCDKSFTSLIKLKEHYQITHNPPLHSVPI